MRILYIAMTDDYGDPKRGPSFEETNFRSALEGMGHELTQFDFIRREREVGRDRMNRELVELAANTRPDVSFFVLFKDEIASGTIEAVGREGGAPTVNWFADDHWRFDTFSRHLAPSFDWSVTTDHEAVAKYRAIRYERVILSQWACNQYAYGKHAEGLDYDVTFVGQPHGDRRETIDRLRRSGFDVRCWGYGWPEGRIDQEEMVRVFGASRINLNLSNSSTPQITLRMRLGALARGRRVNVDTTPRRSQIKGRNFEVPGSGGFLLTDRVPHLEEYFDIGREIAAFSDEGALVEQVGWWLEHPEDRARVAEAGYRRVMAEHTYDHRFAAIFSRMGLSS